jgi:hypothetical protein
MYVFRLNVSMNNIVLVAVLYCKNYLLKKGSGCLDPQNHHRQGRTWTRLLSGYNPMGLTISHEHNHTVHTELTLHLKQSK